MIQSTRREYLLELSKAKIYLDFSKIEESLIDFKAYYNASIDSKYFREYFKKRNFIIDICIDQDCNIFIKDYDKKNESEISMFKIMYQCDEKNIIYDYLQDTISLELLIAELRNICTVKIISTLYELKQSTLVKDTNYWLKIFNDNLYLLNIVNIEDFYNLIGKSIFSKETDSYYYYIGLKLGRLLKVPYAPYETDNSIYQFLNSKNDYVRKLSKCIALDLIKTPGIFDDRIDPYILYALYNNLLSDTITKKILELDDCYYLNFFLNNINKFENISFDEGDIKAKFNLEKVKTSVILEKDIRSIRMKNISNCSYLTYRLIITKGVFEEDSVDVLLKISKMLLLNNNIEIFEKKDDCTFLIEYCTRNHLIDQLLLHSEILSRLLNCSSEKLKKLILKNIH